MAGKTSEKDDLPPASNFLPAIHEYIAKHGGLEDKDEQDKMLRELLGPQYTSGLDQTQINQRVAKLRDKLASICHTGSISYVEWVETKRIEHKKRFKLRHLFELGPSKIFPRPFLKNKGIEVDEESDAEDGSDEGERDGRPLTRGEKRKVVDASEDEDMTPGGKRQKSRDDSMARPANAMTQSPLTQKLMASRSGTPVPPKTPQSQRTQLNKTPQTDHGARIAWAREAGAREDAALLPTHKPANPNEILPPSDAGWTTQQMDEVFKSIWDATLSVFQLYNIKDDAEAKLVPMPDPDLRQLYDMLFKSPDWAQIHIKLSMAKQDETLTQEYAMMALMGAAVYKWVFEKEETWDISKQFRDGLGEEMTEVLSGVIKDLGHDFDTVLRYATGKRIADKKFQEEMLAKWATQQAEALMVIMRPHLKILTTSEEAIPAMNHQPWDECLREAFQKAMHVRLTLDASKLAPFQYVWPKPDQKINSQFHKAVYELGAPSKILTPILPAIARDLRHTSGPKKHTIFSKAKVVPMSLPPEQDEGTKHPEMEDATVQHAPEPMEDGTTPSHEAQMAG